MTTTKIIHSTTTAPVDARNGHTAKAIGEVADRFPYGWRIVTDTDPNGEVRYRQIPLTQADFLDPQIGDQMVQSDKHGLLVSSLLTRFHARYIDDETTGAFSDVKMLWGIPGLQQPAPDLAIIPNLTTKPQNHSSFNVQREGTRPSLVVEVVSPNYPGDDTAKVEIYRHAGIEEYIIIDPHFEDGSSNFELTGYSLVEDRYEKMQPDKDRGLLSRTTGIYFLVGETGRDLVLYDKLRDEVMRPLEEELAARRQAEAAAAAEAAARRQAEAAAAAEAEARRQAEATAAAEIARLKALLSQQSEDEDADSAL